MGSISSPVLCLCALRLNDELLNRVALFCFALDFLGILISGVPRKK